MMAVVGTHPIQRISVELQQSNRIGDIPDAFDAGAFCIAQVINAWVSVVNLIETVCGNECKVFSRYRPTEVGMIEMRQDFTPLGFFLFKYGAEIIGNRFSDRLTALRLNRLRQVCSVDVNRLPI